MISDPGYFRKVEKLSDRWEKADILRILRTVGTFKFHGVHDTTTGTPHKIELCIKNTHTSTHWVYYQAGGMADLSETILMLSFPIIIDNASLSAGCLVLNNVQIHFAKSYTYM